MDIPRSSSAVRERLNFEVRVFDGRLRTRRPDSRSATCYLLLLLGCYYEMQSPTTQSLYTLLALRPP